MIQSCIGEEKKQNKKNKRGNKFIPILTAETVNLC